MCGVCVCVFVCWLELKFPFFVLFRLFCDSLFNFPLHNHWMSQLRFHFVRTAYLQNAKYEKNRKNERRILKSEHKVVYWIELAIILTPSVLSVGYENACTLFFFCFCFFYSLQSHSLYYLFWVFVQSVWLQSHIYYTQILFLFFC